MKSTRDVRGKADNFDSGDLLRKAMKLEPIKKSGKEKHVLYGDIDQDDDDLSLESYKKRDSVLDYFDDGQDDDLQEDDQEDEDEVDDEDEDYDDDYESEDQDNQQEVSDDEQSA